MSYPLCENRQKQRAREVLFRCFFVEKREKNKNTSDVLTKIHKINIIKPTQHQTSDVKTEIQQKCNDEESMKNIFNQTL